MATDPYNTRKVRKARAAEPLVHHRRRMFVITPAGLIYAPENEPRSHLEWLQACGLIDSPNDPTFERLTRGFIDARGVFAYRGRRCEHMGVSLTLYPYLHLIKNDFALSGDTPVWLGVQASEQGPTVLGTRCVGTLGGLLKKFIVRRLQPAIEMGTRTAA